MGWSRKKTVLGVFSLVGVLASVMFLMAASEANESPTPEPKKTISQAYKIQSLTLPKQVSFAGERIPLERFDTRERLDREILSNTYFHSNTILMVKRANRYFPIIEPILKENGVPDDFKYIAMIESGFQPRIVSPSGAAGIWQFLKSTGKEYGLEVNGIIDERYHVEKATVAACKYFKKGYEKFGSWALTAASYNIGMNRITKEIERQKTKKYVDMLLPEETKRYVFRAIALKEIMKKPSAYGFMIHKEDLYPTIPCNEVAVSGEVKNFTDFAAQHKVSYYILKEFNPWLRDAYLPNSTHKTYKIKIPTQKALRPDPSLIKAHNKNWVVND